MTISVVQTQSNSGSNVSTLTVTLTSTGAQNTIIVCTANNGGSVTVSSVVTSGGKSLTQAVSSSDSSNALATVWYLDNVAAGQTSVTVTWNSSPTHVGAVAYEVSGVYAAGGSFDKSSTNFVDGASPTSWTSSSTATLSQASEIAIGSACTIGVSVVNTGPSSPWTNTIINGVGMCAGRNIVSATTALAYAGSYTHSGTGQSATAIATFKGGTPPPASSTSPFYRQQLGRGTPAAVRGAGRGRPGAAYVEFPSVFILPKRPALGRPAAVRGHGTGEPGAAYVDFPSKFILPRKPARGAAAAVRGTGKGSPGAPYVSVRPPTPSPFYPPHGPARGAAAAVRGKGSGLSGLFTFIPPAPWPFVRQPMGRGKPAAVRGTGRGHAGARFVLIRISPFYAPRKPAKGTSIIRAGRGRGSITGKGAPAVPRQLIIALASQAGTDDYGNEFPQGVLATAGVIEGPTLIGSDAFYYSPSPGFGNLITSIAGANGTDAYGNAYFQGTTSYNTGYAVNVNEAAVTWYTSATQAGPYTEFGAIGITTLVPGTFIIANGFTSIGGVINVPQSAPSIVTVPHNPNDPAYGGSGGTAWLSGERLVLDDQIDDINANFSAIINALSAAGIIV